MGPIAWNFRKSKCSCFRSQHRWETGREMEWFLRTLRTLTKTKYVFNYKLWKVPSNQTCKQFNRLNHSTYSNVACCLIIYRFLHQLKEDNSELINRLWTDIHQKIATQSQITSPPGIPSSAPSSREQKGLCFHCVTLLTG